MKCRWCGKKIRKGMEFEWVHDDPICIACLERDFYRCEICGEYFLYEDSRYSVCRNCIEIYDLTWRDLEV